MGKAKALFMEQQEQNFYNREGEFVMGMAKDEYEQGREYGEFCDIWEFFQEGNYLEDGALCPNFEKWSAGSYTFPENWEVLWAEHLESEELKRLIDKDD